MEDIGDGGPGFEWDADLFASAFFTCLVVAAHVEDDASAADTPGSSSRPEIKAAAAVLWPAYVCMYVFILVVSKCSAWEGFFALLQYQPVASPLLQYQPVAVCNHFC